MSDADCADRRHQSLFLILAGIPLLVILYILSPLPINRLVTRFALYDHAIVRTVLDPLYAPLNWAYFRYPIVMTFYDWYLG